MTQRYDGKLKTTILVMSQELLCVLFRSFLKFKILILVYCWNVILDQFNDIFSGVPETDSSRGGQKEQGRVLTM